MENIIFVHFQIHEVDYELIIIGTQYNEDDKLETI